MRLISAESIHRPEVVRWHERMRERYTPPAHIALTVVLPCSARKPYSTSRSHFHFMNAIKKGAGKKRGRVHEVILTSPLGMVPREVEGVYPAAHYDVPVTGHWSREEKDISIGLLEDYMGKAGTALLGHVDGAYREICSELGIPMTGEDILARDTLKELEVAVREALSDVETGRRDPLEYTRKIADLQFGAGAGDLLIGGDSKLRRFRVFRRGEQTCAMNPKDGLLSLTMKGGEYLKDLGAYWVRVSFRPETRSIFAVGVVDAHEGICPGDEVILFKEDEVVGVGRAVLTGREMARAARGLAVSLRHKG